MTKTTYRAMQVTKAGTLELVERNAPAPGTGEVLIEIDACGICGADAADIERADPALQPPRVPGHEVVGRIAAIGPEVASLWSVGQRVGVGRLGGHCNECQQCRQGHFQLCENQPVVGSSQDGGYAEMMVARATGLVSIPDELDAEEAAPLLCAGIATLNALKKCGAEAGDTVAILGIGGLGHLAIQYAQRMGFRVVAVGRGKDPLSVSPGCLVGGERSIKGSITGSPYENEKTLNFSVLSGVRPMVETMPLERANDAYQRMRSGKVQFRMVLSITAKAPQALTEPRKEKA